MAPQTLTITFHVEWKLPKDQAHPASPDYALGPLVTITGSAKEAQAISCSEYLRQTWSTTGIKILQLIQQVLRNIDFSAELPGMFRRDEVITAKNANSTTKNAQ